MPSNTLRVGRRIKREAASAAPRSHALNAVAVEDESSRALGAVRESGISNRPCDEEHGKEKRIEGVLRHDDARVRHRRHEYGHRRDASSEIREGRTGGRASMRAPPRTTYEGVDQKRRVIGAQGSSKSAHAGAISAGYTTPQPSASTPPTGASPSAMLRASPSRGSRPEGSTATARPTRRGAEEGREPDEERQ